MSENNYRFSCRFCEDGTDNEDEDCGCRHEILENSEQENEGESK